MTAEIAVRSRPPSRLDDLLALLAETLDAERHDVADIEELRRLHAGADAGGRACGEHVAGQQAQCLCLLPGRLDRRDLPEVEAPEKVNALLRSFFAE